MPTTLDELRQALNTLDNGVLYHGSHKAGTREFCALEFDSAVRGRNHSDAPLTLPDLRPLNDGPWSSDAARTDALLPVMVALWNYSEWSADARQRWIERVALETVRQIIADLPLLPEDVRQQCRNAQTLDGAAAAAAQVAQAAKAAAWAAWAAAARAARAAAADTVLQRACAIWITAADEVTRA